MILLKIVFDNIQRFLMSTMFEMCSSYNSLIMTMWMCLGLIIYLMTVIFMKIYIYYRSKSKNVNMLCEKVEKNDIVSILRIMEDNPQYINIFSENGYSPFLVACANGNTQIVKFMLRRGADITLKSTNNESPFYLAAFYYIKYPHFKNATCLRELYYAGANVDEPNDKGLTPLQMAAMFGHTALVKWLLLKNASRKVVPDPFLIANAQGHQETAALIWRMSNSFYLDFRKPKI